MLNGLLRRSGGDQHACRKTGVEQKINLPRTQEYRDAIQIFLCGMLSVLNQGLTYVHEGDSLSFGSPGAKDLLIDLS